MEISAASSSDTLGYCGPTGSNPENRGLGGQLKKIRKID
jgi:hypothetical protein